MANIVHFSDDDQKRFSKIVSRFLKNIKEADPLNIIVTEAAVKEYPKEWILHYFLSDKYQSVGRIAESVNAAKYCVELRPRDLRSAYALATGYNMLIRAGFSEELALQINTEFGLTGTDIIDPKKSMSELEKLDITIEAAAAEAIKWFKRSLMLDPDIPSKKHLESTLDGLFKGFPQLKL